MSRTTKALAAVTAVLLVVVLSASTAVAAWLSSGNGGGAAMAATMAAGHTPSLSAENGTVTVTFAQSVIGGDSTRIGAHSNGRYEIRRYAAASGGSPVGGCATEPSGQGASLSCSEQSVAAGTWYYSVQPKLDDWAGQESPRASVTVAQVDTIAPVTTDNAPTGWSKTDVTVTLTATDEGGSGIANTYYTTNGTDPTTSSATGTSITITTEGTTTLKYRSTDVAGNLEAVKTATIRIDKTAPVTTDNAPANWVNSNVTVTLTPADGTDRSGVNTTYYTTNGADPTTSSATGTSITITTEGTTTLKYRSIDVAGNLEAVKTATIRIDKTAPVTTDNAPSGWSKADVTVALSRSDAHSGATHTYYTTNGSDPSTSSPQGMSVTISTEGTTTLKYRSIDAAGNLEAVKSATVRIDKTNPSSATLNTIPQYIRNGFALTGSGADTHSGVGSIEYLYCNTTTGASCSPSTSIGTSTAAAQGFVWAWLSQPADGTYRVVARVHDNAGNHRDSAVAQTVIDNTAPTASSIGSTNQDNALRNGDTFSVTFDEPLDPASVASSSVSMTLHRPPGRATTMSIPGLTEGAIPMGVSAWVNNNSSATVGGTLSFSNGNRTVTFTASCSSNPCANTTAGGNSNPLVFTPAATLRDRAGNPVNGDVNVEYRATVF